MIVTAFIEWMMHWWWKRDGDDICEDSDAEKVMRSWLRQLSSNERCIDDENARVGAINYTKSLGFKKQRALSPTYRRIRPGWAWCSRKSRKGRRDKWRWFERAMSFPIPSVPTSRCYFCPNATSQSWTKNNINPGFLMISTRRRHDTILSNYR